MLVTHNNNRVGLAHMYSIHVVNDGHIIGTYLQAYRVLSVLKHSLIKQFAVRTVAMSLIIFIKLIWSGVISAEQKHHLSV